MYTKLRPDLKWFSKNERIEDARPLQITTGGVIFSNNHTIMFDTYEALPRDAIIVIDHICNLITFAHNLKMHPKYDCEDPWAKPEKVLWSIHADVRTEYIEYQSLKEGSFKVKLSNPRVQYQEQIARLREAQQEEYAKPFNTEGPLPCEETLRIDPPRYPDKAVSPIYQPLPSRPVQIVQAPCEPKFHSGFPPEKLKKRHKKLTCIQCECDTVWGTKVVSLAMDYRCQWLYCCLCDIHWKERLAA